MVNEERAFALSKTKERATLSISKETLKIDKQRKGAEGESRGSKSRRPSCQVPDSVGRQGPHPPGALDGEMGKGWLKFKSKQFLS